MPAVRITHEVTRVGVVINYHLSILDYVTSREFSNRLSYFIIFFSQLLHFNRIKPLSSTRIGNLWFVTYNETLLINLK